MTDLPTEPVTPVIVAHVDRLARRRNRVLVALAAVTAVVMVGVVAGFGVLIYSAAVDARSASTQTVGLQQQNKDLLRVVLASTGCTVADTPAQCSAKLRAASVAEGTRRVEQVRQATQAAIDRAVHDIEMCVLYKTGCPADPNPPAPSSRAGVSDGHPTGPLAPRSANPQPAQSAPTTTPPITLCAVQVVGVCAARTQSQAAATGDCATALAYLQANAAPGYQYQCGPHVAHGAYGMTCYHHPPQCGATGPGLIMIACPLPFVYQNEARNSQVFAGRATGIDAYGQGTPSQDAYCNTLR